MPIKDAIATSDDASRTQKGDASLAKRIIVEAIKTLHRDEITRLKQHHADIMSKQQTSYLEDLARQQDVYDSKLSDQKSKHVEELRKEECAHTEQLRKQKSEHAEELSNSKKKRTDKTIKLDKELVAATRFISTQAIGLKQKRLAIFELNAAVVTGKYQIEELEKRLFSLQPATTDVYDNQSGASDAVVQKKSVRATSKMKMCASSMAREKTIAIFNEKIKYHVQAIRNLEPRSRSTVLYVNRRIKRTEKTHNIIRQALDEGSLGALRHEAIALRSKFEIPAACRGLEKKHRPSMQDVVLLLQCLDKAMKMVIQEKENIRERLEGDSDAQVLDHRKRIKNMFALAKRCGLLEDLEWVQDEG